MPDLASDANLISMSLCGTGAKAYSYREHCIFFCLKISLDHICDPKTMHVYVYRCVSVYILVLN